MPNTRVQLRRGLTAEADAFTGAEGELTYDTEKKQLRIHDGVTQGGNIVDVVVAFQIPTAENNYTWYRKYASGWVEQGGRTKSSTTTITFPIPFKDVPTMTWGYCTTRGAASYDGEVYFRSVTANNFVTGSRLSDATGPGFMWQATGMAKLGE